MKSSVPGVVHTDLTGAYSRPQEVSVANTEREETQRTQEERRGSERQVLSDGSRSGWKEGATLQPLFSPLRSLPLGLGRGGGQPDPASSSQRKQDRQELRVLSVANCGSIKKNKKQKNTQKKKRERRKQQKPKENKRPTPLIDVMRNATTSPSPQCETPDPSVTASHYTGQR